MNKVICVLLISCFSSILLAQKYENFSFMEESEFDLTEVKKKEAEAILAKTYSIEYEISEQAESQYTYIHTAKWVNSDEAIKSNNKIYLAANENSEYLYQRSRVILPNGEIKELKEEDVKEGVYGEGDEQRKYYYYALEGLEKGSVIESVSYKKTYPSYYGRLVYLQEDINRYNQTFELICPKHLVFAFKPINGAPDVEHDTTYEDGKRWTIQLDSINKILDQPNVFDNVVKQSIVYKLDRNNAQNRGDITSYSKAGNNIYKNLHPELSKKTQKSIDKIYKELGLKDMSSIKEKISAIENHVKTNYQIVDANYQQLEDLDFILANKTANDDGITTLQLKLLEMSEVKYEIVVTCDRSDLRFDKDFEAYLYLNDYLLYFPQTKEYMAPAEKYLRGKYIPDLLSNNYGLFIKEVTVGEMKTAIGKVKFIEALPYDASKDVMDINIDFSENQSMPEVKIKKTSTGYSAQFFQPYLYLMDEEELSNIEQALGEGISEQMEIAEFAMENIGGNDFGTKPFVFELSSTEHAFVERAGNDLLFKIGELIGPQMEMYQEKDRQYDVEARHNRYYERTITFDVPEGYVLKNAEEMNFAHKFGKEGKENLFFESVIKQEGEKYIIHCVEYYADIIVPKEQFEEYKTVINAAADFNKKVLILEKK